MTKIKPGQFKWYHKVLLRAKERTNGCSGCIFKDILICPNIKVKWDDTPVPDCEGNNIIFVKV